MGCFLVQKNKKKLAEQQQGKPDLEIGAEDIDNAKSSRSGPPSFRKKVRAIQHAQRFINSNPKVRQSLHRGYGSVAERDGYAGVIPTTVRIDHGSAAVFDMAPISLPLDKTTFVSRPMPLPSPAPSPSPGCYRLPQPHEHAAFSAPIASQRPPKIPLTQSLSVSNGSSLMKALNMSPTSDPMPLPPPREGVPGLRCFSYEELATACQNFSPDRYVGNGVTLSAYSGVIRKAEKQMQVTVAGVCERWQQGYKEWLAELCTVARLHGPLLCKLIGFYGAEESIYRFLVYERLPKGSLDKLLYGRADSPPLDWPSRVKIALSAAEGLAYLHEKASEKIMYRDLRTSNIDVDIDFSTKLSGYGFANCSKTDSDNPVTEAYCAPETTEKGHVSMKSNVWSFGIVLLELLTGRQNMDFHAPRDERNLARWAKPFLMDEGRLFLIMDPKMQGRFPSQGAKMVADLVLQCLQKDPIKRPTMQEAVDILRTVQEVKYRSRFPLREPINTIKCPKQFDIVETPQLKPLIIPTRSCATSFAMEEVMTREKAHYARRMERLEGF